LVRLLSGNLHKKVLQKQSLLLLCLSLFYTIYSQKPDRYYIGYSEDINIRPDQHNTGLSVFTAKAIDWHIVYQEICETRQQAHQREKQSKGKKSRKYIEWIIKSAG